MSATGKAATALLAVLLAGTASAGTFEYDAAGELNRADFGMTQFAEGEAGKVRLLIQVEAIRED